MKDVFYVLYFSAYAFLGWLLESVFSTILKRAPVNRGFLRGFFCPVFGFGGLCAVFSCRLAGRFAAAVPGLPGRAAGTALGVLLSALFAAALEFSAGWLLYRLWEYSRCPANLKGYVCLRCALFRGSLAFAAAAFLQPLLARGAALLPRAAAVSLAGALLVYFLCDFLVAGAAAAVQRYRAHEAEYRRDYEACVSGLLDSPGVQSMEGFIQHGDVSCLRHCRNVSYGSYVASRLLGLNARAAARGALLHDYFLYDWHTNAPYRWHGFRHPARALYNAGRDFELDPLEKDIILRHMWPLTPTPPQHMVSFVVSVADKVCTVREVLEEHTRGNRRKGRRAGK